MTASRRRGLGIPRRRWIRPSTRAFGQSQVSLIYTQLNQYYVVLEVAPQYWQSPEALKNIYLHTPRTDRQSFRIGADDHCVEPIPRRWT